jgi:MFS family permease
MSTVALAFMVAKLTGSMAQMGAVMAVSILPLAAASWIAGSLIDRYSSKWLMVLADAGRAVLVFCMPFVAGKSVASVYVFAGLVGLFSAVFNPAQIKLVAELAARQELVKANSYLGMSRDGAELIGYLAGGAIVAAAGYMPAFLVDAATYLLSALLLLRVPRTIGRRDRTKQVRDLIAGTPRVFLHLWGTPSLRTNLLLALLPLCAIGMYVPNAYGLVLEVFQKGGFELGILEWAAGCGLILGGFVLSRITLAGDKNKYVAASAAAVAFCLLGVYLANNLWLSIALLGVAGMVSVGMSVPSITLMQEASSEDESGRLISIRGGFGQLSATVAYAVGGILGDTIGIRPAFLISGLAAATLTLLIYVPYRITGNRRADAAWKETLDTGGRRVHARQAALEARLGGRYGGWTAVPDIFVEEEK